ncbi:unnamed protein product [Rotaria magnacalcarata]|uniref:acylglycerol lipase n=4 Tax=Rotaria magnacalcarata TaxID=392030 RepID=A0A819EGI6_9BILA|nr:unnamed protein product [Rotaria magnacalcarata]CAF3849251.1 unnamed protein product [Rotaria magnacalcarata]
MANIKYYDLIVPKCFSVNSTILIYNQYFSKHERDDLDFGYFFFLMFTAYQAGLTKHLLLTDNNGVPASFSYTEKGSRNREKPSIVFVHGLSSNKETWIPIVKNIPSDYHCITVDLPGHGETVGFNEDRYSIDTFVEKLKLFFDLMDLTEPLCIIGASMGGAIVCMFAIKYPEYVSMICLLAPIANEASETDLIRQLRNGQYNALLPETPEELRQMINTLTVRTPKLPKPFLNGFLHLRLRLLDEHKKILTSLIGYDYSHIEQHYQQLRQLNRPALILWGRQDKVYAVRGAEFFCNLLPNTECIIFDECGHFMAIDKPEEAARSILAFFDSYANYQLYSVVPKMLSNIYRQHTEHTSVLKQKQEKKKKELLSSAEQLTRLVLDGLNDDVSECYKNQKRIDHACKQLTAQTNLLLKQSQAWITLIGQFTDALKVLGDVENYSKIIERDCLTITNTLANVHQNMTKSRQIVDDEPQDASNSSK